MRSQWKRLAWAAALSCACFGATLLWYRSTEKSLSMNSGETPLAQVAKVGELVSKKPPTRLLWQTVNTGDYLYNGETVRTSERGEIRIQFEDGKFIDLEPDSLVVLQKSKGEIALDLMEGSVYVNAKNTTGSEGPGLVLNSGGNKVDLSGASAALTKGKGSAVDLQVLEGKATVKDKDGKTKDITQGSSLSSNSIKVEVLSPSIQKPFYIDPDANLPVPFKWKGFPAQYKITLMAGPSRKELKDWSTTEAAGASELNAKFPIGKYFWKLVAKDPQTNEVKAESSVYKTEFLARFAPTVVLPVVDAEFNVEKVPWSLEFKWQKGEEAKSVTLEVATDRLLKNKIANKAFTTEESFTVQNLNPGEYYWRVSAFYPDSNKPVTGKVQKFKISKLQKKDPVRLTWLIPENQEQQFYVEKPTLALTWKPENRQEDIAEFKLILTDESGTSTEPLNFQSKEAKYKAELPKAGRYIASIEAYDKEGNVIGKSDPKTLLSEALPLLTAPKFIPAEGVLKSQEDGRSDVKWENINGAKEYQLIVTNKDGKELAKKRYQATGTSLKNLLPGEYQLKIIAFDQYGRPSQESPARTLVVPDRSNIKAPTLKKIKVN